MYMCTIFVGINYYDYDIYNNYTNCGRVSTTGLFIQIKAYFSFHINSYQVHKVQSMIILPLLFTSRKFCFKEV